MRDTFFFLFYLQHYKANENIGKKKKSNNDKQTHEIMFHAYCLVPLTSSINNTIIIQYPHTIKHQIQQETKKNEIVIAFFLSTFVWEVDKLK